MENRSSKHEDRTCSVLCQGDRTEALASIGVQTLRGETFSFLENFHGILQTDAYQAYDEVGGRGMVHAGCWTHARRGFANVVKLNPGDPVATPIVAKINELFALDAEAREQGLSVEARHRLRQQKAPELLKKIKAAIEAAKPGGVARRGAGEGLRICHRNLAKTDLFSRIPRVRTE